VLSCLLCDRFIRSVIWAEEKSWLYIAIECRELFMLFWPIVVMVVRQHFNCLCIVCIIVYDKDTAQCSALVITLLADSQHWKRLGLMARIHLLPSSSDTHKVFGLTGQLFSNCCRLGWVPQKHIIREVWALATVLSSWEVVHTYVPLTPSSITWYRQTLQHKQAHCAMH